MKRQATLSLLFFLIISISSFGTLDAQTVNTGYERVQMVKVHLNGKWGLMNQNGKEVVAPKYDSILAFSKGLAAVSLQGKWGYIDTSGRVVVPLKYRAVAREYTGGLIPVQMDNKWGYVTEEGKEVLGFTLDEAAPFYGGLALVRYKGRRTFMNGSGRMWIKVDHYDEVALAFNDGLLPVAIQGKWGFINKASEVVVPLTYDKVNAFHNGLAAVRLNGKWGFIDTSGKVVVPLQYDDLSFVNLPASR